MTPFVGDTTTATLPRGPLGTASCSLKVRIAGHGKAGTSSMLEFIHTWLGGVE